MTYLEAYALFVLPGLLIVLSGGYLLYPRVKRWTKSRELQETARGPHSIPHLRFRDN